MKFKHAKIKIPNMEYSQLSYTLSDFVTHNIIEALNNGYDNFIGIEVNVPLECYDNNDIDDMKNDLMQICDLTEKEFKKALKNKKELLFYIDYEL